jgi:adenylate cyclase
MSADPHEPPSVPLLRVSPDGVSLPIAAGGSLLESLRQAGVPITHACGGRGRCSTCRVRVIEGLERCEPRTEDEALIAAKLSLPDDTRLACQLRVVGSAHVQRLVLDEVDLRLASASVAQQAAVGRDRELVILFSDIANFTPFSEALPAYDVVHTLDRWFTAAGAVVQQHGGRVDNYMGDGFLAVFDDEEVAVDAALGLLDAAADLSRYTEAVYHLPFRTRMGVHRGPVIVGTLGANHNRRTTVMGDAVNVAARIEAANKEVGTSLLVSDAIDQRLGVRFTRGRRAEVSLKGKSGTHALVEVLSGSAPAAVGG